MWLGRSSGRRISGNGGGEFAPGKANRGSDMAWRSVESLKKLREQVMEKWPKATPSEFGTIGDEAHQATTSDHNPEPDGTVDAMDIPHQPEIGLDSYKLADTLLASHDKRIKYIISNSRIGGDENYAKRNNTKPWVWGPYHGSNAHDHHMHISVNDEWQDDRTPWDIEGVGTVAEPGWDSGRGSWYSQYKGKFTWIDAEDEPNSNALGVPDYAQGISFYNQGTKGKWFEVKYPNGVTSIEQQTEIGPNPKTGRAIDISAAAAERAGYTPKNFPTDAILYWRQVEAPPSVANLGPKDQATANYKLRGGLVTIPTVDEGQDPISLPQVPTNISEAFLIFRKGQDEWNDWLRQHVQDFQGQADNELADLFDEVKPILIQNLPTLMPVIFQFPLSVQAKLFRLGLMGGLGVMQAPQQEEPIPQPQRSTLMTQDQVMSALRWFIATFGGAIAGWAAARGWASSDTILAILNSQTFLGVVGSIVALVFGQMARTPTALLTTVAKMPEVKQVVTTPDLAESTPSPKVVDRPTL